MSDASAATLAPAPAAPMVPKPSATGIDSVARFNMRNRVLAANALEVLHQERYAHLYHRDDLGNCGTCDTMIAYGSKVFKCSVCTEYQCQECSRSVVLVTSCVDCTAHGERRWRVSFDYGDDYDALDHDARKERRREVDMQMRARTLKQTREKDRLRHTEYVFVDRLALLAGRGHAFHPWEIDTGAGDERPPPRPAKKQHRDDDDDDDDDAVKEEQPVADVRLQRCALQEQAVTEAAEQIKPIRAAWHAWLDAMQAYMQAHPVPVRAAGETATAAKQRIRERIVEAAHAADRAIEGTGVSRADWKRLEGGRPDAFAEAALANRRATALHLEAVPDINDRIFGLVRTDGDDLARLKACGCAVRCAECHAPHVCRYGAMCPQCTCGFIEACTDAKVWKRAVCAGIVRTLNEDIYNRAFSS